MKNTFALIQISEFSRFIIKFLYSFDFKSPNQFIGVIVSPSPDAQSIL